MSNDDILPPFDEASWQERASELLPVGGWCQWDYDDLLDLVIGLGCHLRVAPVIRLRRFAESTEIVVGATIRFCAADGRHEGLCLLHADEIHAIIKFCDPRGPCREPKIKPKSFDFGTRGGLRMTWQTMALFGQVITLKFPRSRDALLSDDMFATFLGGLRGCLELIHEHNAW